MCGFYKKDVKEDCRKSAQQSACTSKSASKQLKSDMVETKNVLEEEPGKALSKEIKFTLKQLIRKLHIVEPVENVMCLIGKRCVLTILWNCA